MTEQEMIYYGLLPQPLKELTLDNMRLAGLSTHAMSLLPMVKEALITGSVHLTHEDYPSFRSVVNEFKLDMVITIDDLHIEKIFVRGMNVSTRYSIDGVGRDEV